MALIDAVLPAAAKRLPKVIDARTHGAVDYAHGAFFLGMALVCRRSNPKAAAAALGTGAFILGGALLTDYPLGVRKIIPFETHGRLDSGFASASWAVPRVFGFVGTKAARVFQLNSVFEAFAVGMTDFNSERARAEE